MRSPDIDAVLRPARALLDDPAFWRTLTDGLAVYFAEDTIHVFKTSASLPEFIAVEERFMIRPLLPALDRGEHFYVLALSKNRVRLLEGTRERVTELDPAGLPEGLGDALKYDDPEHQVQFHTRTPAGAAGRGKRDAMFHGHGGVPDVEKDRVLRYFRVVDRALHEYLRDETAPLLLAGVDYLMPIYREVNSYPHLLETSMAGNPDELTDTEIHASALQMLRPHFDARVAADLDVLNDLNGTSEASTDLHEVVAAAHEGRVRILFVAEAEPVWGSYDPSSGVVVTHAEQQRGDWDLADLAAAETLLHGGTVHAVGSGMPFETAAAIFRY
jgi:hypothetical protein